MIKKITIFILFTLTLFIHENLFAQPQLKDYLFPVENKVNNDFSSAYGPRNLGGGNYPSSNYNYDFHAGIDISGDIDDEIYSIEEGTVRYISTTNGDMENIIIEYVDENFELFYIKYIHIDVLETLRTTFENNKNQGLETSVTRGETIAYIKDLDNYVPHLDIRYSENDLNLNPLEFNQENIHPGWVLGQHSNYTPIPRIVSSEGTEMSGGEILQLSVDDNTGSHNPSSSRYFEFGVRVNDEELDLDQIQVFMEGWADGVRKDETELLIDPDFPPNYPSANEHINFRNQVFYSPKINCGDKFASDDDQGHNSKSVGIYPRGFCNSCPDGSHTVYFRWYVDNTLLNQLDGNVILDVFVRDFQNNSQEINDLEIAIPKPRLDIYNLGGTEISDWRSFILYDKTQEDHDWRKIEIFEDKDMTIPATNYTVSTGELSTDDKSKLKQSVFVTFFDGGTYYFSIKVGYGSLPQQLLYTSNNSSSLNKNNGILEFTSGAIKVFVPKDSDSFISADKLVEHLYGEGGTEYIKVNIEGSQDKDWSAQILSGYNISGLTKEELKGDYGEGANAGILKITYGSNSNENEIKQAKIKITATDVTLTNKEIFIDLYQFGVANPFEDEILLYAIASPITGGQLKDISWSVPNGNLTDYPETDFEYEYSINGGINWTTAAINHGASGDGSVLWSVPAINATNCLFRMTYNYNEDITAVSDEFEITDPTAPKITDYFGPVSYTYYDDSSNPNITIEWGGSNLDFVDIYYRTDNTSSNWIEIIKNKNVLSGTYNHSWTPPAFTENLYPESEIKIVGKKAGYGNVEKIGQFILLTKDPFIIVNNSLDGTIIEYTPGQPLPQRYLEWEIYNIASSENFKYDYSPDNGVTWKKLIDDAQGNNVGAPIGPKTNKRAPVIFGINSDESSVTKIRISLQSNTTIFDTNDGVFTVLNTAASPIHYVSTEGDDQLNYPFRSIDKPARTFEEAIKAAADGDKIIVAPGTYKYDLAGNDGENKTILVDKELIIESTEGAFNTIIDFYGSDNTSCIQINNSNAKIVGFTIMNGSGFRGAGAYLLNGGTLENCIIKENEGWLGGGIKMNGGKIINCLIMDNVGQYGGGVNLNNSGEIINCTIVNNGATLTADNNGGGVYVESGVVKNSIIYNNTAVQNTDLRHNIWFNSSFSNFYNVCTEDITGLPGSDNIQDDPLFIDTDNDNYRFLDESPCFNKGNNQFLYEQTDLEGKQRKRYGIIDIGAFETQITAPIIADFTLDPPKVPVNGQATLTCNLSQGDGVLTYDWIPASVPSDVTVTHNGNDNFVTISYNPSQPNNTLMKITEGFRVKCTVSNIEGTDESAGYPSLAQPSKTLQLEQGWNWVSLNLDVYNMSLDNLASGIPYYETNLIKNQTAFAQQMDDGNWLGSLKEFNNVELFMINIGEDYDLSYNGSYQLPSRVPIHLEKNWNWISYTSIYSADINFALGTQGFKNGDQIVCDNLTAEFNNSTLWAGTLTDLEPGKGYKIKVYSSKTFTYPDGPPPAALLRKTYNDSEIASNLEWHVNSREFEHRMFLVLEIINKENEINEEDLVASFFEGECRGFIKPVYLSQLDKNLFFVPVMSKEVEGEEIDVKYYSHNKDKVYRLNSSFEFSADSKLGSIEKPLKFNLEELIDESIPESYLLKQNYPNPFNPETTIEFAIPEDSRINLVVYNMLGQEVKTLVSESLSAGYHKRIWDGRDNSGKKVTSGIYLFRITSGEFNQTNKMILLK